MSRLPTSLALRGGAFLGNPGRVGVTHQPLLAGETDEALAAHAPDVVVIELGANDGLRGLPLGQTRANLQAIIDKVKAKNPKVRIVLAGMMVPPNLGEEYTTEFKEIYPRLARKNNASLIPFLLEGVAGDGQLNLAYGIHPNVAGHKIVARTVLKTIEPLLK